MGDCDDIGFGIIIIIIIIIIIVQIPLLATNI
jgi:hypothetical protein